MGQIGLIMALPAARYQKLQEFRAVQRRKRQNVKGKKQHRNVKNRAQKHTQFIIQILAEIFDRDEHHHRNQQIHQRAGRRGYGFIGNWPLEIGAVHRHGLAPADPHQKHQKRPQRIQMPQGIQGHPPVMPGGGIPQQAGGIGMGKFMQRDHQNQGKNYIEKLQQS